MYQSLLIMKSLDWVLFLLQAGRGKLRSHSINFMFHPPLHQRERLLCVDSLFAFSPWHRARPCFLPHPFYSLNTQTHTAWQGRAMWLSSGTRNVEICDMLHVQAWDLNLTLQCGVLLALPPPAGPMKRIQSRHRGCCGWQNHRTAGVGAWVPE